jgi:oxygen-dependent protoporphyrinogen oxidase
MTRVVIVGAGISGLALAYRLHESATNVEVIVLEQDSRPGGKIWTDEQDGFRVEVGPNGFLDNKPSTLDLCRDLGLEGHLVRASETAGKNRYLLLNGRLVRLPDGVASFLRSSLLSWRGKAAVLGDYFRRPRVNIRESVDAFVRRRLGQEAAEVIGDAFVTGIHAGDPTLLSARAALPRMTEAEDRHGGLIRGLSRMARERRAEATARGRPYERAALWSFRAGLRLLVETLVARLPRPPLLGAKVQAIEKHDGRWTVRAEGRDAWDADAVVLTCPAYRQAAVLAGLDAELAGRVSGIPYNRVAVVALGYRRPDVPAPLDGFGFIAPQRTRRDLLGVQWCSSIFPDRAPPGMVLWRAMCGGWNRPDVVGWDDTRLLEAVRSELRQALGIVAPPSFHRIVRWERAIPQYHLGHPERVAWIGERVRRYPGLFLGGNAYHGIALNDCTEEASRLAARLRQFLTAPFAGGPF